MAPSSLLQRRLANNAVQPSPQLQKISPEEACSTATDGTSFAEEFSVGQLLGSGSMAAVYRVRRNSNGKTFAGKRTSGSDEEVQSFVRAEHKLLVRLKHESIVEVDTLRTGPRGELWLILELCEDGCVQDYVEGHGAFSEKAAMVLMKQLLAAVDFLHSKRVVHRDIKPQNLLLTDSARRLKLADFNSAKQLYNRGQREAMLSLRSTPLYFAPEVRRGGLWNERVDIWTTGLSTFFMLKGRLPYGQEAMKSLVHGAAPCINWGGSSHSVRDLVMLCLAPDMRMRPAAMELLKHAALPAQRGPRARSEGRPAEAAKPLLFAEA